MKTPNFICVGAQKAGTTTLHEILKQHPDIYLPKLKEAHFFDNNERYSKGIKWWIDTFFNKYNGEKIMGVITPDYLYYPEVPEKIVDALGENIKIIILLRNPADRAYSHYLMSKRRGYEEKEFNEALKIEKYRINRNSFNNEHYSYVSRGLYYEQVLRYYKHFNENDILVIKFEEEFINNKEETIKKILSFLNVHNLRLKTEIKKNYASQPRSKFINKILYGNSSIMTLASVLIKSNILKIKLGLLIDRLNQKRVSNSHLSKELKENIIYEFFYNDIKKLETYLRKSFKEWY